MKYVDPLGLSHKDLGPGGATAPANKPSAVDKTTSKVVGGNTGNNTKYSDCPQDKVTISSSLEPDDIFPETSIILTQEELKLLNDVSYYLILNNADDHADIFPEGFNRLTLEQQIIALKTYEEHSRNNEKAKEVYIQAGINLIGLGLDLYFTRGANKGAGNSWYKADGSMNYPPNNGAVPGTEIKVDLQPGQSLGRYGNIGPKSNYVTAPGALPDSLSLPPNTSPSIYTELQVVKPIPGVTQSTVAPWGGSTGLGLQYELPMPIQELIKQGYIIIK
ncbi:TNT domain-containing protein, partial [Lutispora saccharofermentans]